MAFRRRRRSRIKHIVHHHVRGFRFGMKRRRSRGRRRRVTFISGQRF